MRMRHIFAGIAATLVLCSAAVAQTVVPVKVGVILPFSGGSGSAGQHIRQAIDVMASLINADGGVMGRPIEILARDDESTPAVGVSRATELIAAGVDVVLEGWNSPVTLAMQPLFVRANVLDITIVSKADPILSTEVNPLGVRINSSNAQDGLVIANYIAHVAKARRVAFLTQNDAYGNGARDAIEKELRTQAHTYEKVAEEKFPFTQTDFRVALTNIRAANPEVTVLINANESVGMPATIRQFRQSRVPGTLLSAVGAIVPSMLAVAGTAADGMVGADSYFPDVEPFASNPINQRFVAKTREMFNYTPDKYMALGAAALQVWAMAANTLQTLDRQAIARHIRGGRFPGTVMGELDFAPNGQAEPRYYLLTVVGDKIVLMP